jgi:hypothetical protein
MNIYTIPYTPQHPYLLMTPDINTGVSSLKLEFQGVPADEQLSVECNGKDIGS